MNYPPEVKQIMHKFETAGFEIYVVGGVIRDKLLNRPLYDWDLTTNATPEQILELIPDSFYDNKFGTVGVPPSPFGFPPPNLSGGRPIEITTYRSESEYTDSRHPDKIYWGKTLQEDLQRRDFTINAMAVDIDGEIIDSYNGQKDCQAKIVRAVGDPNIRFNEDALRMMRAVRIATQLGFSIEEETFTAIKNNAEKIKLIAMERIRDELLKIMASDYPADGYLLFRNCGLAAIVLPEMENAFGVEQKSPGRHHIYDVGTHSVEALRFCPSNNPITRLATLIHDVGKVRTQRIFPDGKITFYNHEMESEKIAKQIAERLKFSNEQKELFTKLVRWHQFTVDERQTDSAIRRIIKNVGPEDMMEMLALRTGDRLGGGARETSWRLEEFKRRLVEVQKQPFKVSDLKISGNDVMKMKNVPSGPMVGKYLNQLFEEVEKNGLVNDREILIKKLEEL